MNQVSMTPPIEDSIENKLNTLFNKPAGDKAFYLRSELEPGLLTLIESEKTKARIDEAKRAANHNNSAYTSDYLEDRIIALYNQLKQTKEPKEEV